LSGADALTVFVAVRNSGPGQWRSLVLYSISSDTGLQAQGNTGLSTGSSFTAMQVDLRPSDYGRAHTFTVVADPANTVVERSESNNQLRVRISLPASLTSTAEVPCSLV